MSCPDCAQRLSASKIGSLLGRRENRPGVACSTPVGIKDRFTLRILLTSSVCLLCSTPVGIKDRFTEVADGIGKAPELCSTPVGIKDRFTITSVIRPCQHDGAQRLSASKIGSHQDAEPVSRCPEVLNACRHQRSVHLADEIGDKRLDGAQRLSASKIGSLAMGHLNRAGHSVLNACRHQRSVHPSITATRARASPGAQRLSASKIGSPETTDGRFCMKWCSTPVGIKDRFTHELPGQAHGDEVLNACRHQRSVHKTARTTMTTLSVCSTPVGIKDRFTK